MLRVEHLGHESKYHLASERGDYIPFSRAPEELVFFLFGRKSLVGYSGATESQHIKIWTSKEHAVSVDSPSCPLPPLAAFSLAHVTAAAPPCCSSPCIFPVDCSFFRFESLPSCRLPCFSPALGMLQTPSRS